MPKPQRGPTPKRPSTRPRPGPPRAESGPGPERTRRSDAPPGRDERAFLARGVPILFEDADVLVVEKPIGMITADPNAGSFDGPKAAKTLFDLVKQYTAGKTKRRRGSPPSCYIIHRLDKDASGVLVFAKSPGAFERLKADLKAKDVERVYLAVAEGVVGSPGETGTIDRPLRDDPPSAPTAARRGGAGRAPREEGPVERPAITHFRVLATGGSRSLLQVRLETGRKNQIRAHMAMLGHPLIGDRRFEAGTNPIGRLGLHAWRLAFNHPISGKPLSFESRPPASFHKAVGLKSLPDGSSARTEPATRGTPPQRERQAPSPTNERSASSSARKPLAGRDETSWEAVAGWYDRLLDDEGSDHYRQTILPGVLRLLQCRPSDRVLDVACGQGVLCRRLGLMGVRATGVDASASLVEAARLRRLPPLPRSAQGPGPRSDHEPIEPSYEVCDARSLDDLNLPSGSFDASACVMALTNIDPLEPVLGGVAHLLAPGGCFVAVISHPVFRSIGRTSWGWDADQRRQYRRIDGYLSAGRSEIQMHPGKAARGERGGEAKTVTFHRPIETYVAALAGAGLLVDAFQEWPSARVSDSGPRAAEENRARGEIPMFLAIRAVKPR